MRFRRYHITFKHGSKQEQQDLPPGLDVAQRIQRELSQRGIPVSELEIWRDAAWSWRCFPQEKRSHRVDVVVSRFEPDRWLLSCSRPLRMLSFFSRLSESGPFRATTAAFLQILKGEGFSDVKWYFHEPAFAKNARAQEVTSIEEIELVLPD